MACFTRGEAVEGSAGTAIRATGPSTGRRLHFNSDGGMQARWNEKREANIAAADEHWPELVD